MNQEAFQSMSVDELWTLHEKISATLATRIGSEKRQLEDRLHTLRQIFKPQSHERRRPYPKVVPKFQNPAQPAQTWAGRGKQPRWFSEMIKAGRSVDDLRIRKTA
jgi:DNA-binding protein H-NS